MDIERLGPYQIVGQLGRGGMGTVYEGVHRDTGEPAAVKLLSAALAQEGGFRSRFEAEIETLRKLNHPNIVRLFGFGEQDTHLFYAMELVDGNSLEEELRQGRLFDWRSATKIAIEVCRALRHAHDRGIIHRDIKPGNLLVTNTGQIKLSDFGIARLFGNSELTSAGSVLGTAEYMAPEQAEGRPVDTRADLYSLGAVMYVLLARRPMFQGQSLPEVLHKQRYEQPEPIRKFAPDAPQEFERILNRLLEKDPEARYPTATALGRRLDELLETLALAPATVDADSGWFASHPGVSEPSNPSTPSAPNSFAETMDIPPSGIDLSATEAPSALPVIPVRTLQADSTGVAAEKTMAARPPIRFIPVAEDELDQQEEEEAPRSFRSWQTWALIVSLLVVGGYMWWSLQPPSADALYQRIIAQITDATNAAKLQAAEDIEKFLSYFPNDPRAPQIRKQEAENRLLRLERYLDNHARARPGTEDLLPIQREWVEAIRYSELEPERGASRLQALIDLYERKGDVNSSSGDGKSEDYSGPTGECLMLARGRLEQLKRDIAQNAQDQVVFLQQRLDVADALRNTNPESARSLYRAVIELYDRKPWAADVVHRARESLQQTPLPPPTVSGYHENGPPPRKSETSESETKEEKERVSHDPPATPPSSSSDP